MTDSYVDEKTISLRKPITIGAGEAAVTYSEIKLREPDAGELEKAQRADTGTGSVITLVSLIAKIPRGAVEKFSQRDIEEANQYFRLFSGNGQPAAGQS